MGGEPGGDNLLVTFGAAAGLASFSSQSMCQAQGCPLTESPVSVAEMTRRGPRAERLRTATYVQKASGPVMTEPRPQGLFLHLPHHLLTRFLSQAHSWEKDMEKPCPSPADLPWATILSLPSSSTGLNLLGK